MGADDAHRNAQVARQQAARKKRARARLDGVWRRGGGGLLELLRLMKQQREYLRDGQHALLPARLPGLQQLGLVGEQLIDHF